MVGRRSGGVGGVGGGEFVDGMIGLGKVGGRVEGWRVEMGGIGKSIMVMGRYHYDVQVEFTW